MDKIYDLVIVGAGPAGITAAIYAARKRMDFTVLTVDIGGQTAWSGDIENYVGYQFISGIDLTSKFEEHMHKYGIDVKESEKVTSVKKEKDYIAVVTEKTAYRTKTVIIASGKRSRELGVQGEKEFRNKGVAYCATCDAPLFHEKDVVIVGGGNSAVEAAIQLIKIANHVYLVNSTKELGGDEIIREKVVSADNVTVMNSSEVSNIEGEMFVSGVAVKTPGGEKHIDVQGVFVEVGLIPNSGFESDIEKNDGGEIKVTFKNETNLKGVYAAGDVTDVPEKQIIIAAGEGAKATLSAFNYISRMKG